MVGTPVIGLYAATNPAQSYFDYLFHGSFSTGSFQYNTTAPVDPTSAFITDQAVKGERSLAEVRSMVFYLALTAILGTLLSQLILYPSAVVIAFVAHAVNQLR